MAIEEISKSVFDLLDLFDHCQSLWEQDRERAWFIDTTQQVVGVLLEDVQSGLWGYSICRYRDDGQFHRIAVASGIPSVEFARRQLVSNMQRELVA